MKQANIKYWLDLLPNPYDPTHPSIFKDWRAQGYVDLRHAIAVSSDVYFYEVGGGFQVAARARYR
jgi:cell division protein FtsI/penicillin-binding protein 2